MAEKPSYEELEKKIQKLESQAGDKGLFENMDSGVAVYEVKGDAEDFIFKDFNPAAERIDNQKKEELIGQSIFKARPQIQEFGLIDAFKEVWRTGKPKHFPLALYQDEKLESWYENFIYKSSSHEIVAIFTNETDSWQTRDALARSEAKYRSMMEAMLDPVYICSEDFRVEYANPAMIRRIGPNAIGEYCFKAVHDLEIKCPWCVHDMIQQGKSFDHDIISPKDSRSFHVSQSPIVHDDGSISKMTVYRDTTEFKKMESQLLQSQKTEAIGALAGGIAHDFNNILFPIVGFAEMLEEDLPEDSDLHKNVNEILAGAKRAKELIRQILTFSRQAEQDIQPLKPHLIIKEVAKFIRSTIPTSIEIKKFIDPKTLPIMSDPTQIHQVAMNLITNSYQAMEESGGILTIRLQNIEGADVPKPGLKLGNGPYILLSIGDTGRGIDKITLEKIFDPYFTTKPKGKGTGLGLSVVNGIVKNYGGQIIVKSSSDKGTVFDVYIPAIEKDEKPEEHHAVKLIPRGNERILLVDDEEQVLDIEQKILERLGYKIEAKNSSIDALKLIKANPDAFDLIISDMAMPKMTGDRLVLEIMDIKPTLPIILCTGFSEKISLEKLESMGIKALLLKPIIKSKIAITVRKVLDEAKSRDTR